MVDQPEAVVEAERARRAIRDALGTFLTGVTVVTTTDDDGQPRGITANSFTSVSLDPPLVLVCVDQRAASYDVFTAARGYAVNILGQDHQHLAERFATKRPDKFLDVETVTTELGNPVIRSSIAWLDCRTTDVHSIGDHAVLVGHVQDFGGDGGQPLGFHQGRFMSFNPLASATAQTAGDADVTWVIEDSEGRVALSRGADGRLSLPGAPMSLTDLHDDGLEAAARRCVGATVTVDLLYSFYTDERSGRLTLTYRGRLLDAAPTTAVTCTFRPLDRSLWPCLADDVELTVLQRFRVERDAQRFGIYSGTAARGSVATIHEVRPDAPSGTILQSYSNEEST